MHLAAWIALLGLALASCGGPELQEPSLPPNIVLVMTDDQGWAQVGWRGNEVIQTPHLDRLAAESVEFTRFYVSPVCAPTRASLMTGRYNYRTGVVDTYLGRAMRHSDERTLPEMLGAAGYRSGIFGKWRLGDNYPMRPQDQGFDEVLVHGGGGIGQPADPPGNSYFDPILRHDGIEQQRKGYCTHIFFDAAIEFIERNREKPFFAYIPTNAPHSPYLVPDSYIEPYKTKGLDEKDAAIYGMITNIDDNVGRLVARLDDLGLAENTILIFMTDNGPTTRHFTAGLRSQKASVYEGGVRVPFLLRWPAKWHPLSLRSDGW
jgi:arylsulfatase A-like enzyme